MAIRDRADGDKKGGDGGDESADAKADDDDGAEEEDGDDDSDVTALGNKLKSSGMPPESSKIVMSEFKRLKRMNPAQAEYGMLRSYLECIAELPWSTSTTDNNDINAAKVWTVIVD